MRKIFKLFIMLFFACTLFGCTIADDKEKPSEGVEQLTNQDNNEASVEQIQSLTFVKEDTYGFENVFKYSTTFDISEFANANNLNSESNYLVIDNFSDWAQLYLEITGIDISSEEESDVRFENIVKLVFVRKAVSSNHIKITYQFDANDNRLNTTHPFNREPGDDAIFECIDIVDVSKTVYNSIKVNEKSLNYTEDKLSVLFFRENIYKSISSYSDLIAFNFTSKVNQTIIKKYDATYFEANSLIAFTIPESSGGNTHALSVTIDELGKVVVKHSTVRLGCTYDMAYWIVFIELPNEDLSRVTSVVMERNNKTYEIFKDEGKVSSLLNFEHLCLNINPNYENQYKIFSYDATYLKNTEYFKRILASTYEELPDIYQYNEIKKDFFFSVESDLPIGFAFVNDTTSNNQKQLILIIDSNNVSKYYKVNANTDDINLLFAYIMKISSIEPISLAEAYPELNTLDNITNITLSETFIGVSLNPPVYKYSLKDMKYLNIIMNTIKNCTFNADQEFKMPPGGILETYTIYANGKEVSFSITNGYFSYNNIWYKFNVDLRSYFIKNDINIPDFSDFITLYIKDDKPKLGLSLKKGSKCSEEDIIDIISEVNDMYGISKSVEGIYLDSNFQTKYQTMILNDDITVYVKYDSEDIVDEEVTLGEVVEVLNNQNSICSVIETTVYINDFIFDSSVEINYYSIYKKEQIRQFIDGLINEKVQYNASNAVAIPDYLGYQMYTTFTINTFDQKYKLNIYDVNEVSWIVFENKTYYYNGDLGLINNMKLEPIISRKISKSEYNNDFNVDQYIKEELESVAIKLSVKYPEINDLDSNSVVEITREDSFIRQVAGYRMPDILYKVTNKEAIKNIIDILKNAVATVDVDNAFCIEPMTTYTFTNEDSTTVSISITNSFIYNNRLYKTTIDLIKYFNYTTMIKKSFYQGQEIANNTLLIVVKSEYKDKIFTQEDFQTIKLESIRNFENSQLLFIVPKDFDKYNIHEAIELVKDLYFVQSVEPNYVLYLIEPIFPNIPYIEYQYNNYKIFEIIDKICKEIVESDYYSDEQVYQCLTFYGFLLALNYPDDYAKLSLKEQIEYIFNSDIKIDNEIKVLLQVLMQLDNLDKFDIDDELLKILDNINISDYIINID